LLVYCAYVYNQRHGRPNCRTKSHKSIFWCKSNKANQNYFFVESECTIKAVWYDECWCFKITRDSNSFSPM